MIITFTVLRTVSVTLYVLRTVLVTMILLEKLRYLLCTLPTLQSGTSGGVVMLQVQLAEGPGPTLSSFASCHVMWACGARNTFLRVAEQNSDVVAVRKVRT